MNRSFKSVFNRRTGLWQAASEIARGTTKAGGSVSLAISAIFLGLTGMAPTAVSGQTINVQSGQTHTLPGDYQSGTYSGGSIYSGGTLNISSAGTLNNYGTLNNILGGTLNNNGVLTNTIGGTLNNYGTLNNILGGTLNNNGVLSIGGALNNNGTLYNNDGSMVTNLGTLTNSGALFNAYGSMVTNSGTLTNNGALTSSGLLTNEMFGTLTNAFGGTLLIDFGTLTNDGTLNNSGLLENFWRLENRGTLTNASGSTLTNHGTLTNTGTLTNAGTLTNSGTLNNSGTLTGNINLDGVSSRIVFQGTVARTYADVLSGSGSLWKEGSGTLNLAGANTYTGTTTVTGGTLNVTGSAVSATTIIAGTLTGSGSVGGTTVSNGGTVHLANNNTLTIAGDYTQQSGSVLRVDANAVNDYGKLVVTGNASFAAQSAINVNVNDSTVTLANGNTLASVVTVNGTLTSSGFVVTDNSALFNFRAIEHANAIDLVVTANSTTGIRDAVNEHGYRSASGAAAVLDANLNNGATGDMGTVIDKLGQMTNNRDVARAAAQTLPVISGNQAVQGTLNTFQKVVQNHMSGNGGTTGLASGDALSNKNAWGKVFGSRAEQDDRSGAAGFKADTWGLALGADAQVAPGARFGVAYGYAKTSVNGNTDLSGSAQRANIGSHVIAVYGGKDLGGNRTFSFQGDIGVSDNKSTRNIDFMNRTARADYRTYSAHIGTAISQAFELNERTTLKPALRADYMWLKSQGYNETGADALNLSVDSNKTDAFVIGADAYLQHRFSNTTRLDANLGIGYDAINEQGNIVAAYVGAPGQSFVTTGINHSPWLVRGGIGYSLLATNGTEVSFRYDAEGRSDYLNHTASIRAKWAF